MFVKDLSKKLFNVLLILSVSLAVPVLSLSQEQNEISAERIDTENLRSDVGLPTLDEIKERRAFVECSEDILEKDKKNVLRFLDQASRFIEERVQLKKSAEEITRMVATAPARIKEIEAKLERPPPEEKSVESQASKMEPAKIEQHVRQLESDVAAAKKIFGQREDQLKEQESRPEQLRQAIERAKQRLIEIDQEIKAGISQDATPLTAETRRVALLAEQDKLLAEIESHEQHLANHDTLISLITVERDLMSRELNRRELIVPNNNFITGELINWSLSDKILRLDVPVGIAYGSDTAPAKKLLLKVAEDNPEVLDKPEPSALFWVLETTALTSNYALLSMIR